MSELDPRVSEFASRFERVAKGSQERLELAREIFATGLTPLVEAFLRGMGEGRRDRCNALADDLKSALNPPLAIVPPAVSEDDAAADASADQPERTTA